MTTHVLLVDDDVALTGVLVEALQLQLRDLDLAMQAVPGSDEALAVTESLDHLDLLIVDYHLGPVTGFALHAELQARFPHMQTLLYTGKATADVEAEAHRAGVAVLWKPERLDVLAATVRTLLSGA